MPVDGPLEPGSAYECQSCGERTIDPRACPTCGSDDLERLDVDG